MGCMLYAAPLLLATVVLADYYIDNANTSVVYSMPPSQSGLAWQTFSVGTQSLALSFSNSSGNYSIPLDASHCYDQNYALGVCGTTDNCFVQIPFTGSGITMYVFNAGVTGMTASFSVDGGAAVPGTIEAPPPPTYQVSNVSLYNIQGLPTGIHTIKMTLLDWNGGGTSMKFDYAHVNETFVASPAMSSTSSMTPTSASQTSSQTITQSHLGNPVASNKVNIGAIVGPTLGGLALLVGLVIGFLYLRKRKATRQDVFHAESPFQVNPFTSEFSSFTPLSMPHAQQRPSFPQYQEAGPSVPPLMRSAILRDALAAGNHPTSGPDQTSPPIMSGQSPAVFQPLRLQTSHSVDIDISNAHQVADVVSPFMDYQPTSRHNLTAEQIEIVDRLRLDNVPPETIARVIDEFVTQNPSGSETDDSKLVRERSIASGAPPPSYQTRDGRADRG